ncbi:hypothetical protein GCK72_008566 [Caenorhabditis remanei]|uniref:F-box domain-containing protein n=1 Tax=Caenorhabditis remanei TaxID=31234 RepID=A0A6A5GXW8_CAERE|nr:hypothetical protein GCK72_008566 [Caenorhabditis remanei]KAF1760318.1 hypothetical protein GCK72_008566 [Caenorhabditis remanei]
MEPPFPLLRLPKNVIIKVIKNFPLNQLFVFSLVSTKTKNLVTSLGLKASDVDIIFWRGIRVIVFIGKSHLVLDFYKDSIDLNAAVDITLPVAAYVVCEGPRTQSTTPLFNFSDWLNHIKTVFCCNQPSKVFFCLGCERLEIDSLKEIIGNANKLILSTSLTDDESRKVLKCFNTLNELYLYKNPFENACQIQQIFIQNCEIVEFFGVYSLDDMLMVNSEQVKFWRPISLKQFNQFMKHWIRGSNPRLQRMYLPIDKTDFVNGKIYLKGIRCMKMSEEAKREIRRKHDLSSYADVIKIRRKDGTPAVIGINEFDDILAIRLIVLD